MINTVHQSPIMVSEIEAHSTIRDSNNRPDIGNELVSYSQQDQQDWLCLPNITSSPVSYQSPAYSNAGGDVTVITAETQMKSFNGFNQDPAFGNIFFNDIQLKNPCLTCLIVNSINLNNFRIFNRTEW